jgi:hypothetical protein
MVYLCDINKITKIKNKMEEQELTQQEYQNKLVDLFDEIYQLTLTGVETGLEVKDTLKQGIALIAVTSCYQQHRFMPLGLLEEIKGIIIQGYDDEDKETIFNGQLFNGQPVVDVPLKVNVYGLTEEPFKMEVSNYDMNAYERTEILDKYVEDNNVELLYDEEYRVEEVEDTGNGLDFCEETWFVSYRGITYISPKQS